MDAEHEQKVDHYLDKVCAAEVAGNKIEAEKHWKAAGLS